jgi:hypothetical protein
MTLPAGPSRSSTTRRFCRPEPRRRIHGSSGFPGNYNGLVSLVADTRQFGLAHGGQRRNRQQAARGTRGLPNPNHRIRRARERKLCH